MLVSVHDKQFVRLVQVEHNGGHNVHVLGEFITNDG
jgi:hypothetical protein